MEKDMTKGSPLPVILQFTLPLIIGNIFQQLYNMADTIIVGRYVGADALAAVGSTGTIMFLVLGFAQGITAGFTVLTSQRFGAKDTSGVKRSVANGILLALLFTVVLTFFSMISMRPLLHLMNTPENIFQDAYTCIMIISAIDRRFLQSAFLLSARSRKQPDSADVPDFFGCIKCSSDLLLIIRFKWALREPDMQIVFLPGISAVLCLFIFIAPCRICGRKNISTDGTPVCHSGMRQAAINLSCHQLLEAAESGHTGLFRMARWQPPVCDIPLKRSSLDFHPVQ